ncbi:MAG TPA: MYXO-CTERM sorting domain-containing protein, partial [Polyangiaceae bacterium]|nr:MYXO-CTERM sorting domain-containing protein [Polyangiaceae bacterium]
AEVEPGTYLLVVDTFVDVPIELEGAYELDVDFVPEPGTEGCAAYLTCQAGSCVCADGLTDCGECVDVKSDDEHCGACGVSCAAGESCDAGACVASGGGGGVEVDPDPNAPQDAEGCGCRVAGRWSDSGTWLALLGLGALGWRRRRG